MKPPGMCILDGLTILSKYGGFDVRAEHDQIWSGDDNHPVSTADAEDLIANGWHPSDEGGWSIYV